MSGALARLLRLRAIDKREPLVQSRVMDVTAEQWELFPQLATRAPAKSKVRQWMDALAEHGPLLTPSLTADALGVSRARVHQLLNNGRIASVMVGDERFVPSTALDKFLAEQRGPGFRRNTRLGLGSFFAEAERVAEAIVNG